MSTADVALGMEPSRFSKCCFLVTPSRARAHPEWPRDQMIQPLERYFHQIILGMVCIGVLPSRRTASRGSGGTEGPTRDQNKKGACRTKLHREHRRRGAWDGAVAVQQVLFPGHSLARARVGVFGAVVL